MLKGDTGTRAEVAVAMGVSPQAIKKLWSRARKRAAANMTAEELAFYTAKFESTPARVGSLSDIENV